MNSTEPAFDNTGDIQQVCLFAPFSAWKGRVAWARNFFFKPYFRWQANRDTRAFSYELASAPERYKPCWARLLQGRITLAPDMGMLQTPSPHAIASQQLAALHRIYARLANRSWYQASQSGDWSDLAHATRRCHYEWHRQVAKCGLELCQDNAEVFVPQHFPPEEAAVILAQVRGQRLP
jgi:hypothetical protein